MSMTNIKKCALFLLFSIGLFQLMLGLFVGRLRVELLVGKFWTALGLVSAQSKVFTHYIDLIQDQWNILIWSGLLTMGATLVLCKNHKLSVR